MTLTLTLTLTLTSPQGDEGGRETLEELLHHHLDIECYDEGTGMFGMLEGSTLMGTADVDLKECMYAHETALSARLSTQGVVYLQVRLALTRTLTPS